MKSTRQSVLPWYGYLALNAVVWVLLLAIYLIPRWDKVSFTSGIPRSGVPPLLLYIAGAFMLASIYDAVFDRVVRRRQLQREAEERPEEESDPDSKRATPPSTTVRRTGESSN
ncbi:hypothetical protein KQI84_15570 [bacterium]|nr:hypothetical protein [bacterium]